MSDGERGVKDTDGPSELATERVFLLFSGKEVIRKLWGEVVQNRVVVCPLRDCLCLLMEKSASGSPELGSGS